MEIKGKVHCFFEQSGTFKNEFIKLGIPAEDYDIKDNFGQTDNVIDLFAEIEKAYGGGYSVFDKITPDDLIMAFFPCVEFNCVSQAWYSLTHRDFAKWNDRKKIEYIVEKSQRRQAMFELLLKFIAVCVSGGYRMLFENPWGINTYLKQNVFLKKPSLIDNNRTMRGDYFVKPTAFWYWNCEPTYGLSLQPTPKGKIKSIIKMQQAKSAGLCSEERSMISPDYARNFICDFIIGRTQKNSQCYLEF